MIKKRKRKEKARIKEKRENEMQKMTNEDDKRKTFLKRK